MAHLVAIYKVICDKQYIEGEIISKINAALPNALSSEAIHRVIDRLINTKLVIGQLKSGTNHWQELRISDQVPDAAQITAMSELAKAQLIYLVLLREFDPTLERALPLQGLKERIRQRFPFVHAESVIVQMNRAMLLPRDS